MLENVSYMQQGFQRHFLYFTTCGSNEAHLLGAEGVPTATSGRADGDFVAAVALLLWQDPIVGGFSREELS